MSFILDALKKAESERSRASGPVLVDVRIAPPRRRLPAWAGVLGGVLLANLAVLAWLMLRTPPAAEVIAAGVVAAPVTGPIAPATPGAATSVALPPLAYSPNSAAVNPAAPTPVLPGAALPDTALPAGAMTAPPPATTPSLNGPPADLERLPTPRDLQAAGIALPALTLNLHVYDPAPALRYVMLNGLHLSEGEFTPDGIKVSLITERGVVLEARGRRFFLLAGG